MFMLSGGLFTPKTLFTQSILQRKAGQREIILNHNLETQNKQIKTATILENIKVFLTDPEKSNLIDAEALLTNQENRVLNSRAEGETITLKIL